ncbi:MAG: hypothetical protein JSW07_04015, partial [bacterium]
MLNFERLNYFYHLNKVKTLDHGSPAAKFILLPPDNPQCEQIKRLLLIDPNIIKIINRLSDPISGINSLSHIPASYQVYGSFYWVLRFLADIGLTAKEYRIDKLISRLQLQQFEDGQFMIRYHRQKQQTLSLVCMTAHLTYCLIRLGYKASNTVKAALNYIVTTQRKDGGWHCDRLKQPGERDEFTPSCPAANIHIIRVLGQYGKKYQALVKPAINQITRISNGTSHHGCEFDSQQPLNLNKLRYPPHYSGLDILNVVHSLSFFPDLIINSNFDGLVNSILNRWDGKN